MLTVSKVSILKALLKEESLSVVRDHLEQAILELQRHDIDGLPELSDKVKSFIRIEDGSSKGAVTAMRLYHEETDLPLYSCKLKVEDYVRELFAKENPGGQV